MAEKTTLPEKAADTRPRRWDPGDLIEEMRRTLARPWADWMATQWPFGPSLGRLTGTPSAWAPRADVFEQNGAIVVKTELPGVKKEDIAVEVEDGDLVIRGERKSEEKVEEKDYYRMERSFGSFHRRLPLPEGVTAEQIEATYEDGVLEVRIPKPASAKAQPQPIAIK